MAFTSKLRLFNNKVFQCSGDELNLSGITSFGTAKYQSDVSGSFTPRSFTDVGYVTGLTNGLQSDITYLSGQTDLRLLISDFNTYTGDTQTTIDGISNDITYISGQTDLKLNISDFNTYTGDTQITIDGINNDITYISGQTDTNTSNITSNSNDITFLSSLSGITESSITGATNGLTKLSTKDGNDVKLGGALTENTDISALGTYDLTFTGGLLAYSANYSGSMTPRSIPDADWVTGQTGAISADNGLSREGDNIVLGGILTGDTEISGDNSYSITLGTTSSKLNSFDVDANSLSIGTKNTNTPVELTGNSSTIGINSCDTLTPQSAKLNVDRVNGIRLTFDNSNNTIYYDTDYSTCFNSRSLPDVAYVTGITSTLVTTADFNSYTGDTDIRLDDIETTFITGATNGLTKSGQDIELGGALTENTNISALGTYDLTFTGGDIKYSADYSGQFEARSIPDVAWVTGQTGAIDANNGLSREGDNITLGGTLTGDTEISGSNILKVSSPFVGANVDYFDFSTTPTLPGSLNEGMLYYSANTLTLKREFSGVSTQLGQENVIRVSNVTGSVIENGSVVYFTGAVAGIPTVAKAIANDFTSATQAFGVATHSIADNEEGYVTTLGAVRHLNTGSFTAGDIIWLSETTAGGFTNVRPDYPNYSVAIGEVTQVGTSDGIIFVKPFYVPNYTEYGDFTGYTASTEVTLNNKLDTSVFNTYTGDTDTRFNNVEEVTNIAVTGQTGGLTKVGDHELRLGGTIEQNTTISGSHTLTLAPADRLTLRTTGNNDINIDAQGNGAAIFKAQQGNLTTPDDFTNAIGIFADFDQTSGFVIYDNRTGTKQEGIRYDNDYSGNFNDRSLVDKAYVDAVATGLQAKAAVDVATTTNITLSGLTTVDGITLSEGDRILVKDQTTGSENGIYSASTGNWSRTEDYDFSPSGEIANGDLIPVLTGDTNQSSQWILTTEDPIESGDTLSFSLFSQLLDISAGNGIDISTAGSTKQISVDLATNSGLGFNSGDLTISSNIAGSGLTWNTGVLNVCATDTAITGSEINVKFGETNNNLVVDSADFQTVTATNGLQIDGSDNITLGGSLTQDTTITGNVYNYNINGIGEYNLTYQCPATITDNNATPRGLQYASDYSGTYTCRSLVDAEFVNDQITGNTLTYNNGLTKNGDTISWGGTLTGDTSVSFGAGRICMLDGGTSCIDIISDCSRLHVENNSTYLRSCQNGSCLGRVSINNTGEISITTNNATTGITITDNGAGVGAVYGADYSGSFVDRSLIDKAYVDTCVTASTGAIQANNGLSREGNNIVLGGSLTGDTCISTCGDNLTIGETGNTEQNISILNGDIGLDLEQYFDIGLWFYDLRLGNINGPEPVYLQYADSDFKIVDNRTGTRQTGLEYDADYSANFNNRSLIDKAYVDTCVDSQTSGITSNAITGATNGLSKDGQDVKLGGELTENVTITGTNKTIKIGDENRSMSLVHDTGFGFNYSTLINTDTGSTESNQLILTRGNQHYGSLSSCCNNGTNTTKFQTHSDCIFMQYCDSSYCKEIKLQNNNMIICDSSLFGLEYDNDYSTNFTERSLPDVAYVTGLTSTIENDVSQAITGATNGLTKTGQDIILGGTLTGTTTIDGTQILNINISSFNVTGTTTIESTLTLNSVATGSNTDDVLTITSGGEVQKISASELGEDNNRYDVTGVTNSTVNLDGSEYVVLVNTGSGSVTVNLEASPTSGTAVKIKDKGNALTNNITIDGNGNTIDGSSSALINTDYGALELVFDGTEWFSLAFIN
jgi:hypothetical protein